MSDTRGVLIIGSDAVLHGEVQQSRRVEVHGVVEGGVVAREVIVYPEGRMTGKLTTDAADVRGQLHGEVRVHNLISIRSTGDVMGNVKYGRLAIEEGGELAAQVRNVPPSISGDLDLTVPRAGSVRITRADLSAFDPDDAPQNLTFNITNAAGGFVARAQAPRFALDQFTQDELADGQIIFVHDGGGDRFAKFDIVVNDASGASSGAPKTVNVAVRA
ncbi:MAG: polymer-forming cytoskeletal protein [Hyphomicrobium sp.]